MKFLHTKKRKKYYAQVIEIYQQTGYGADRIRTYSKLPLNPSTIRSWIVNFENENGRIYAQKKPQSSMKKANDVNLEALQQEILDLKEELRKEKLRNLLNDKIIEIAEKKYRIEIRKKAGAKQ